MDFKSSDLVLEKYRYVLEQKRSLNDKTFALLSVYQSIFGLACGGLAVIFMGDGVKNSEKKEVAIDALILAVCGVGVLTVLLLVCGIISWKRYKSQQIRIEEAVNGVKISQSSRYDLFRWYETYIIIAVIMSAGLFVAFARSL